MQINCLLKKKLILTLTKIDSCNVYILLSSARNEVILILQTLLCFLTIESITKFLCEHNFLIYFILYYNFCVLYV